MAETGDGRFDGDSAGWVVPTVALVVILVAVGLAALALVDGPPSPRPYGAPARVADLSIDRTTGTPSTVPPSTASPVTTPSTSAPTSVTPTSTPTSAPGSGAATSPTGVPGTTTPPPTVPPTTVTPGSTSYRAPDGSFGVQVRTSPLRSDDRVEVVTGLATRSEYLLPTVGGAQIIIAVTPDQLGPHPAPAAVDAFVAARAGGVRWWVGAQVVPSAVFDWDGGRAVDAAITFDGGRSAVRSVDVAGRLHQLTLVLPDAATPVEATDALATFLEVLATYRPAA